MDLLGVHLRGVHGNGQLVFAEESALRGTWKGERGQPRDERVRAALEQVERYKAKVERLKKQNQLRLARDSRPGRVASSSVGW